jgi:hypothetical protein
MYVLSYITRVPELVKIYKHFLLSLDHCVKFNGNLYSVMTLDD